MKKHLFSLTLLILALITVQPQHLNGVIYYQNSGGQTAAGVQVSALGCDSKYSQPNGMFTLNCKGKKPGNKLTLTIGNTDGAGKNIEIVNNHQLEWLKLSDRPKEDIVEIIVCEAGKRNEVAARYYDILITSTHETYDKESKEIKAQLKQQKLVN